jgi:hypothetical protein
VRFYGRDEVARRRQKIAAAFSAIAGAAVESELLSHYSRYLCVLVSGYFEQSVKELVVQYCRARSPRQIVRYVNGQISLLRNINKEKLKNLIESLDPDWWQELAARRESELEALDSVATVRNAISHGQDTGITMITVKQYYAQIDELLRDICDWLDPENTDEA